jgi:hypothetical protein
MGARPTCGGALQGAVPRPRHTASLTQTSVRCMRLPNAAHGSRTHAMRPEEPGVWPRGARRGRPGTAGHARSPCPWWRPWGRGHGWRSPEPGGHAGACSPPPPPRGSNAARGHGPKRAIPRPAASSATAPGPRARPRQAADLCHCASHHTPQAARPSVGTPPCGAGHVIGAAGHAANTPMSGPGPGPGRAAGGPGPERFPSPRQPHRARGGPPALRRGPTVHRQRRSPGWGDPSPAFRGWDRTREPSQRPAPDGRP